VRLNFNNCELDEHFSEKILAALARLEVDCGIAAALTPGDLKPPSGHTRDQISLSVTLSMQSLPVDRVSIRWSADSPHWIDRSPPQDH